MIAGQAGRLEQLDDVEPVEPGHLHVEEHQGRIEAFDRVQRRVAVLALAYDLDSRVRPQQRAQPPSRDGLVVHDQGPQRHTVVSVR
jgi:hypothetical protein